MTRLANLTAALAGLGALAMACWAGPAAAYNDGTPQHGECFTCGNATGALPPPGLYFEETAQFGSESVRASNGDKEAVSVKFATSTPIFIWVPDVKVAGASLGLLVVPPVFIDLSTSAVVQGVGNVQVQDAYATLNPAFIGVASWNMGNGLFVSADVAVDPNWGSRGVADDFTSVQAGGAVSYLANGLDLTYWTLFEFNTQGSDGRTDGIYWYNEFTGVKNFGYLSAGVIGAANVQITNDTGPGAVYTQEFAVGPYVEKEFGAAALKFYWTHDVYCQGIACGDTFFLRVDAKLF
jgi:hypothetical protein